MKDNAKSGAIMTHDELLEDLNTWVRFLADKNKGKEWVKALRAVVELHKPNTEGDECMFCGWECGGKLVSYPCPTIQVIEKELG